jgi:hypothetical protein
MTDVKYRRPIPWAQLTQAQQEAAYAPYELFVSLEEFIKIRAAWWVKS